MGLNTDPLREELLSFAEANEAAQAVCRAAVEEAARQFDRLEKLCVERAMARQPVHVRCPCGYVHTNVTGAAFKCTACRVGFVREGLGYKLVG
jgi:hypothetical protein